MNRLSIVNDLLKTNCDGNQEGFWNSRLRKINKDTSELMEVLIKESRLTLLQKQQIRNSIKPGACHLPVHLHNIIPSSNKATKLNAARPHSLQNGIRSRQSIINSGCYERTRYQPNGTQNKDNYREKERLQNLMSYGQEISPEYVDEGQPTQSKEINFELDELSQLEQEIEIRVEFLDQMKNLGQGKQYRSIILTEISQRQKQIKALENLRNAKK